MQEEYNKLNIEFTKWRNKYIDFENYMEGSVFHYTSAVALENIIKTHTLWVTKSDFLNDKTEFMYAINIINELYRTQKYKYLDKSYFTKLKREINLYLEKCYIFSASQNNDSVNLWSNYSLGEGYNIGLNLRDISNRMWDEKIYIVGNKKLNDVKNKHYIERVEQNNSIIMSPGKVVYNKNDQKDKILDILNFLDNTLEKYYLYTYELEGSDKQSIKSRNNLLDCCNFIYGTAIRILANQIQLFKNPLFSQDEEFRIIFNIRKFDVIKFRQFKGVIIPYIEVVFEMNDKCRGLPLDSITIGPKNNLDIADKGLNLFLKSQGYKIVKKPNNNNNNALLLNKSAVPLRY